MRTIFQCGECDLDLTVGGFLQAGQGAGDIHRDVAATDDDGLARGAEIFTGGRLTQQINRLAYVRMVAAGDTGGASELKTQTEQHGIALGLQIIERDVLADTHIAADIHPDRADDVHVLVDDVVGQAVFGNAPAGHAAGLGKGLENRHGMALLRQIEGGGEAGRAGADDGDFLAGGGRRFANGGADLPWRHLIHDVALEPADGDRVAFVTRGAGGFAFVRAHPAADAGKRVCFVEQGDAACVVAIAYGLDVVGNRHVRRAGGDAQATGNAAVGLEFRLVDAIAIDDFCE